MAKKKKVEQVAPAIAEPLEVQAPSIVEKVAFKQEQNADGARVMVRQNG
jgi:hypothetical protein